MIFDVAVSVLRVSDCPSTKPVNPVTVKAANLLLETPERPILAESIPVSAPTEKVLNVIRESYPILPVIVRTKDESSVEKLQNAGATDVVPEVQEGSLMLASHALVLLGIPLSNVIKKIRIFRSDRYKMFRGYFAGATDVDSESVTQDLLQLHSIEINEYFFANNKTIYKLMKNNFDIEIQYIRRPNMLENI